MSEPIHSHRNSALACPVCRAPLQEITKAGVAIDTCGQCRGVWLDRGELEKLAAALGDQAPYPRRDHRTDDGFRDWHDDDDDDHRHRRSAGYRPKSKLSRLMDFFD